MRVFTPEQEPVISSIIKNERWGIAPYPSVLFKILEQIKTNSNPEFQPYIDDLIQTCKAAPLDLLKADIQYLIKNPVD